MGLWKRIDRVVLGIGLLGIAATLGTMSVMSLAHFAQTGYLPTFLDYEDLFGRRRGFGSHWWTSTVPPGAPGFRESFAAYMVFLSGAALFVLVFLHLVLRVEVERLKPVGKPIVYAMAGAFAVYAAMRLGWV